MYDPESNEVAPFEEFMGSHGDRRLAESALRAGARSWSEVAGPIVGVKAMHEALRGWLTETGLELNPHAGGRATVRAGA
jgi:hypothetical protein